MCTPLSNNFTALNEQAAQQLNQERQNVVEATLGGRYLDKFSIETAAVMGAASTWSGPTTSGTTSGLQCAMRGALLAIAADLAKGLPDLLAAPDKNAAARQLIPIILRNAAIAGLSFTLVQHLKCYLEKNVPSIAQALGIGLKGTCHTVVNILFLALVQQTRTDQALPAERCYGLCCCCRPHDCSHTIAIGSLERRSGLRCSLRR